MQVPPVMIGSVLPATRRAERAAIFWSGTPSGVPPRDRGHGDMVQDVEAAEPHGT